MVNNIRWFLILEDLVFTCLRYKWFVATLTVSSNHTEHHFIFSSHLTRMMSQSIWALQSWVWFMEALEWTLFWQCSCGVPSIHGWCLLWCLWGARETLSSTQRWAQYLFSLLSTKTRHLDSKVTVTGPFQPPQEDLLSLSCISSPNFSWKLPPPLGSSFRLPSSTVFLKPQRKKRERKAVPSPKPWLSTVLNHNSDICVQADSDYKC